MNQSEFIDPFNKARIEKGFGEMDDQNDPVVMLLRHKDVRKAAHDWKTFSSNAVPGRIVVPSEVNIRDTRQIPFEVDPPMHGDYRKILAPWFKRPLEDNYQKRLEKIIREALKETFIKPSTEVISEFALPIQSRALTLLLNVPYSEAKKWILWGTHVFRSEGEALDKDKASILYDYIDEEIDKAIANPSNDLYSMLLATEINGEKLTKEEIKGIIILTFAGGRDTVINAITNTIAYFAEHPSSLAMLKENPEIINNAVEELVRYFSPLTHMGREVTKNTTACEHAIKADTRVSLCWAAANRDENVFEDANTVKLDRKLNPHVGFGFSHHNCLGATHARQILRTLLKVLIAENVFIKIENSEENIEELGDFKRKVGFNKLHVQFRK
ncbi:cytochrome P450 [Galbibacter orientalis DSM 19592]|uniref:Cytochrome P450 n=1 Tax=Galbibacter orientalis DSM 19592 TaxID=926559 RepID=I3CAU7_9FLAO|nr:cytochrome P450 [Galbibacter orientalis]EIJ40740.1 cytochrome P450 [Galbibacter orientalis DSM 19592]